MINSAKLDNWNFGKISRIYAEQLLNNQIRGAFLIRESEHYPGDVTLSIKDDNKIQHYRIKCNVLDQMYTIDDETYFSSLQALVQHYELDADGLCCRLERPLSNKCDTVDSVKVDKTGSSVTNYLSQIKSTIDHNELKIGKLVGSGEFSEVYEGTYRRSFVAIKVLKDPAYVTLFLREAEILGSLKHRNLVQFLGITLKGDNVLYLITEFMAKGSLLHYLTTRGRTIISPRDLLVFSIDVCEGLSYLEENCIVHCDIAASNVLIADDNTAKVSDFGLARSLETTTGKDNGNYTIADKVKCRTKWAAIEALESKKYTHKSDVWSYGILLWEIYSYGRCPYPRISTNEILWSLKEGYRMDPPEGCPLELADIMRQSWHVDPERRPCFSQIVERLKRIRLD